MMETKKIFQQELKKLQKKYYQIDEGLDWLRLGLNKCNFLDAIKSKYKYNSTTGSAMYNVEGYDLVLVSTGKQGKNFTFVKNYQIGEFNQPISLFSITERNKKNNIGYPIMVNFYGLFFQLARLNLLNIDNIVKRVIMNNPAKVTRADYNYNYNFKNKKEIEEYIKKLALRYIDIKNKQLINNETFYLRYRQSKGRIDGKVVNGETKRLGLKRYDKSQDIIDLGLGLIFQQYEKQAVLRFEVFLGNQVFRDYYRKSEKNLVNFIKNKLEGKLALINSQNQNKQQYKTNSYIKRTKKITESYLTTYLKNGGNLSDLTIEGMPIREFVEKKSILDKIIFKKTKEKVKKIKTPDLSEKEVENIIFETYDNFRETTF